MMIRVEYLDQVAIVKLDRPVLVGLNEIRLGVPVPYLADCILRHLIGVRLARDVMDSGEFYRRAVVLR
jgi:hypothetical protein